MLIYGIHSVLTLINHKPELVFECYLHQKRDDKRISQIEEIAQKHHITILRCSVEKLNKLANSNAHQGVVARCKKTPIHGERELFSFINDLPSPSLIAVLEQLQDPRNLGACLRSCKAFSVDCVILTKNASAPINEVVYKTSAGVLANLVVFQVSNLLRVLKQLKKAGIWLTGLDGSSNQTIYQSDLSANTALIIGNEGQGLKKSTRAVCDQLVRIPIDDQVESLNVSTATAIALFETNRQRQTPKTQT